MIIQDPSGQVVAAKACCWALSKTVVNWGTSNIFMSHARPSNWMGYHILLHSSPIKHCCFSGTSPFSGKPSWCNLLGHPKITGSWSSRLASQSGLGARHRHNGHAHGGGVINGGRAPNLWQCSCVKWWSIDKALDVLVTHFWGETHFWENRNVGILRMWVCCWLFDSRSYSDDFSRSASITGCVHSDEST